MERSPISFVESSSNSRRDNIDSAAAQMAEGLRADKGKEFSQLYLQHQLYTWLTERGAGEERPLIVQPIIHYKLGVDSRDHLTIQVLEQDAAGQWQHRFINFESPDAIDRSVLRALRGGFEGHHMAVYSSGLLYPDSPSDVINLVAPGLATVDDQGRIVSREVTSQFVFLHSILDPQSRAEVVCSLNGPGEAASDPTHLVAKPWSLPAGLTNAQLLLEALALHNRSQFEPLLEATLIDTKVAKAFWELASHSSGKLYELMAMPDSPQRLSVIKDWLGSLLETAQRQYARITNRDEDELISALRTGLFSLPSLGVHPTTGEGLAHFWDPLLFRWKGECGPKPVACTRHQKIDKTARKECRECQAATAKAAKKSAA